MLWYFFAISPFSFDDLGIYATDLDLNDEKRTFAMKLFPVASSIDLERFELLRLVRTSNFKQEKT